MRPLMLLCLALVIGGSAAAMAQDPPDQITAVETGPEPGNAAGNASRIEDNLRAAGFTDIEKTTCSGVICKSKARWQGNPVSLSIELRTGRVQTSELPK